mgnify:FL=1
MIFTDKAGEDLVISEDLFRAADGALKLDKGPRKLYMPLIARTLQEPDEIWWVWEQRRNALGSYTLRRRYIARFDIEGTQAPGVVVFEHGQDGWTGSTAFSPNADRRAGSQDAYLNRQRGGTLAYRKK